MVEFATYTVVVLSLFDMLHVTFCHCLFEKPVPTKICRKRLKLHKYLTTIFHIFLLVFTSVADPDPGSGAFLPLDPGSGIGFFRFPDPKPIFLRA